MINTQSGATVTADVPDAAHADARTSVVDTVEAFGRVGLAISEGWESERVLRLIAALARRMASSARCSMYLREGSTERFRGRLAEFPGSGAADDIRVQRLVCGGAADLFTREILTSRAPVLIANARTDRRPIQSAMRAWDVETIVGVPMLVGDRVTGLLFLDELTQSGQVDADRLDAVAAIGRFAGVAVAQVDAVTALRGDLSALGRQNRLLRQSSAVEDRFAKLALVGPELERICTLAGELSHKPCVILDAGMRQLAADDGAVRGAFLESCRDSAELADAAAAIPEGRASVVGPLPAARLATRALLVPIVVGEERWGYVALGEVGDNLTPLDGVIARRAAATTGVSLAAERRAAAADAHARQAVVRELALGSTDDQFVVRRAEALGLNFAEPQVVCVLSAADGSLLRRLASSHRPDASQVGRWSAPIGDGAVLLIGTGDRPVRDAVRWVADEVASRLDEHGFGDVRIAVSRPCRGPEQIARGFADAQQLLACQRRLAAGSGAPKVLTAFDLGAMQLFLAAATTDEVERYAEDTIGSLLDGAHHELLRTMRTYFDTGRSIRATAARLGVHGNTIRYRLSRVQQLTGLDVAFNAHDQLAIQVALQALWLRGALPEIDDALDAAGEHTDHAPDELDDPSAEHQPQHPVAA